MLLILKISYENQILALFGSHLWSFSKSHKQSMPFLWSNSVDIMKNLLWEIYIPNNMMYPALFQKLSHPGINQGVTRLGLGKCWEIVVVSNRIPVNVDADFVLVHFTKILIIDRLMCVSCHLNRASNDKSRVKFWMFVLIFFSANIKIRSKRSLIHSKLSLLS